MSDLLGYTFLSIPLIGAYVMFALGISVIYRASRVLNLAHGAMAMVPAYLFHTLAGTHGWPNLIALPLSVISGAALGVVVELLFVRRLRPQGATAQTVGTIAVTGLLVALAAKIWGTASILAPTVFSEGAFDLGGNKVSYGNLGLLVVGLLSSAGMFAFFRFTDYGLAMRGAAQNRTAARLMGVDPDRAASVAWALGGGLAALAGILLAAVTSLDPYTLSLQVLPAFVAALIGGLESLIGALAGAVIVGLAFGLVPALGEMPLLGSLFRSAGAPQLVLTLVAFVVMIYRGRRIVGADESTGGLAPSTRLAPRQPRRTSRRLVIAALLLAIVPWIAPFSVLGSALLAMQYTLVAVSLVMLIGWVGQISLAHATFVGIGAFSTALFARNVGLGFPVTAVVGAVTGALAATILGAVALRVRGLYLAVATLIFAWMGQEYLFRASWMGVGGGSSSLPNQVIGTPGAIPSFDLTSRRVLYFVFLALTVTVLLAAANVRDTRTGRAFFAVRGSEAAAASLGINVVRTKLVAFAVSGFIAGLAGSLLVLEQRTIVPAQFLFTVSLQYLAIAVVGGLTSLSGAVAAGLLFAGLNELFFRVDALAGWLEVVSAALLAIVLLLYPGGLAAVTTTLRRPLLVARTWWQERSVAMRARLGHRWSAPAAPTPSGQAKRPSPTEPTQPQPSHREGHQIVVAADLRPRDDRPRLLDASNVTVRFGGLTAVKGASLTVHSREIVGLIGPNGAGKTTLFNAILGLNDPAAGAVVLHGVDVSGRPSHERARLGVARTFQVVQLFSDLNVADNLLVATHLHNDSGLLSNVVAGVRTLRAEVAARERVDEVLELLGLTAIAGHSVQELPFGLLRMVELGRALVTGAPLLLLDEAASGLNDAETDRLMQVVHDVRDLGVSVLLIEHDIRMVTAVSDYMYVLDQGEVIAEGEPSRVRRDERVITAYLGRTEADPGVAANA